METHYSTLGVSNSATPEEIRRAYRILARRYHPDLNPGAAHEERFKKIASAYATLNDSELRRRYDLELDIDLKQRGAGDEQTGRAQSRARRAYERAERLRKADAARQPRAEKSPSSSTQPSTFGLSLDTVWRSVTNLFGAQQVATKSRSTSRLSLVEVSLSLGEALFGVKKTIEVAEPTGMRKLSVRIPAGTRTGSVIHLRSGANPGDELVLVARVARHPSVSIEQRGLVIDLPVTLHEAIAGATVTVPTIDEPILLKIPPMTQGGTELRVRERGVVHKDGTRGDLFFRVLLQLPSVDSALAAAIGSATPASAGVGVRAGLPRSLKELS